eukprot:gene25924-43355_t
MCAPEQGVADAVAAAAEKGSSHAPRALRAALGVLGATPPPSHDTVRAGVVGVWLLRNYFLQLVAHLKLQKLEVPQGLAAGDGGDVSGVEVFAFGLAVLCLAAQCTRFLLREWRQYDKMRKRVKAEHKLALRRARKKKQAPPHRTAVLLAVTLVLIVLGGFVFFAVQGETLGAAFWSSWVFVQFERLRQGTAKVVEIDHVLILGWSDKTISLIRELATANQSAVLDGSGSGSIVILADSMEKQQMEEEVGSAGIDLKGSTVVCRKGNPTLMHDLRHVNASSARGIIICAPPRCSADEADAKSLRT